MCFYYNISVNWAMLGNGFMAFALGSFYGFTELLSRYQRFNNIWAIMAGRAYILFNGAVSLVAFGFMEYGKLKIALGSYQSGEFTKVLLAGTAAMLVLRSSVANLKLNGKDVQIGLAPILQVFLNAVNREYDRNDALLVLNKVTSIMQGVDFDHAERNLPFLSEYLMKSLSDEETERIGKKVSAISVNSDANNQSKVIALGLSLVEYTGYELLGKVVDELRDILKTNGEESSQIEELLNEYNVTS